ncbi:MAG: DUF3870 domain-containing protein [Firmicutes bacterium]|nr:DUF3870 domain-containing protein [Bacillota bacterium]
MEKRDIFLTGYAKLPRGITATELYSVIAVGIVVEYPSGNIKDVDCSLVTSTAKVFVKDMMVGKNIMDFDVIERDFNTVYFGSARKALISAVKSCHEKFTQIEHN